MSLRIIISISLYLCYLTISAQETGYPDNLYSRPERTRYAETSLHSDVMKHIETLVQKSPLVHWESMGTSFGGRTIPLVIIADPAVSTPEDARASGKPVLYIQANIHGGEVEGKEAVMQMMREIAFGQLRYLLENQILLFCPVFNADGNDALGSNNRSNQDGSPFLAGRRESGQGFDLNRDGLKLETIEGKAFMEKVLLRWNPVMFVDLHTTNGTWHGYAITVAPGVHTAGHAGTTTYLEEELFPWVNAKVKERAGHDIFYYGDFYEYPPRTFNGMAPEPRYLTNSVALRNRLSILVETFSHDRFEKRISGNIAYLTSLLEYTSQNSTEIKDLLSTIDQQVVTEIRSSGGALQRGVSFENKKPGEKSDLLVYEVKSGKRTGKRVWFSDVTILNEFSPVRLARVPVGYAFPGELTSVADKLKEHGISIIRLAQNTSYSGENFTVTRLNHDSGLYQGHRQASVEGTYANGTREMPAGSWFVDMAQPLAYLIFYLLEPTSDDGLVHWNYFDDYLTGQNVNSVPVTFPVFKVFTSSSSVQENREEQDNISVLYNPAAGKINVYGLSAKLPSEVEVFSSTGQLIKRIITSAGQIQSEIGLPTISTGILMVAVTCDGKRITRKVFVRNIE